MGFLHWLRQQRERIDTIGDIARYYLQDPHPPKTLRAFRFWLAVKGTPERRDQLERAIAEWRRL
jgi:hypothetical protein